MRQDEQAASQTAAGRLAVKLQIFFDLLSEDEKELMARIVRLAVDREDVEGNAVEEPDGGSGEPTAGLPAPESPNPIDDFRANLGLYLRPDA